MKMKNLLKLSAICLIAAAAMSCQKEPVSGTGEGQAIILKMNFGAPESKAQIENGHVAYEKEVAKYTAIDIFFTDAAGKVLKKYTGNNTGSPDQQTIWNNLTKGVRFLGLEGVSRVYVVAHNGSFATPAESGNMSELEADIKTLGYSAAQAAIPYLGADYSLATAGDVSELPTVPEGESSTASQTLQADITIRPVISRLQMKKIGVIKNGSLRLTEKQLGLGESETEYKVEWTDFNPTLVGIYMSNFYKDAAIDGNNFTSAVTFATPGNEGAIANGAWGGLEAEYNKIAAYHNYDASYKALFNTALNNTSADGNNFYFYDNTKDGEGNKVIPFNFFVPYDITSAETEGGEVMSGALTPAFHLQFTNTSGPTISSVQKWNYGTSSWDDVIDEDLKLQIKSQFTFPTTADGTAFANIVKFYDGTTTADVEIQPAKIYNMSDVLVTPFNITGTTKYSSQKNVVVKVTVVNFTETEVDPGFDK